MSSRQVFCSHCGFAQMAEVTSDTFFLHCSDCAHTTLGLGTTWVRQSPNAVPLLPLPPVVSYQETEFTCAHREASLSVEIVIRSNQDSDFEILKDVVTPLTSSSLSREELAFLSELETS